MSVYIPANTSLYFAVVVLCPISTMCCSAHCRIPCIDVYSTELCDSDTVGCNLVLGIYLQVAARTRKALRQCNNDLLFPKFFNASCRIVILDTVQDNFVREPQGNNLVDDAHMSVDNVVPNEEASHRRSSGNIQDAVPSHVVWISLSNLFSLSELHCNTPCCNVLVACRAGVSISSRQKVPVSMVR